MQILIPTLGRPQAEKQTTYNAFREAGLSPVLVANSIDDIPMGPYECIIQKSSHVGEARNNCLDFIENRGIIVDDDLTFYKRMGMAGFFEATPVDLRELVRGIDAVLDFYAHGGIPSLMIARHAKRRPYDFNTRYLALAAFNTKKFPNPPPRYRLKVHEDVDFNLQLLASGRDSFVWNEWAYTDPGHVEGGVQTYVTDEMREAEYQKLAAFHPTLVKGGKVQWKLISKKSSH